VNDAGPPGASTNGLDENLWLFQQGKCGMWNGATVAASFVANPKDPTVADKVGFKRAPDTGLDPRGNWLSSLARFGFITLPHLGRALTIVILIQTIFLLSIFAEIFVTTGGAFGTRTLSYLIFQRVLESQSIGLGTAGGIYAVILANIIAIFLKRIVGKNLDA